MKIPLPMVFLIAVVACLVTISGGRASAQPEPGGVCKPVSERNTDVGCWILAHDEVGVLSQPAVFWHLTAYPARAAAGGAKGGRRQGPGARRGVCGWGR